MSAPVRATLLAVALVALPARAVDFALNIGALEVVLLPPAHGGFSPYVGGSFTVPLVERLALTTSLSLEWSPDVDRGGLVLVVTADWQLTDWLGVDLNAVFIHDQAGLDFSSVEFYAGGGPGLSFFFGKWILSPFVSLLAGLRTPGLSLVPGLNLARIL